VKVAARAGTVIFLMDGNIHDKLILGKHSGNEEETTFREKRLYEWLEKKGF